VHGHSAVTRRTLSLRKERLAELTTEELAAVAGAAAPGMQTTTTATNAVLYCLRPSVNACLTGTETYSCLCA
jgi:hypothetical protein